MKILDILTELDEPGNEAAYRIIWHRTVVRNLVGNVATRYMRFVRELQEVCDYETV